MLFNINTYIYIMIWLLLYFTNIDEGIKVLLNSKSNLKKINCSQCTNISNETRQLLESHGIELLNNQVLITI